MLFLLVNSSLQYVLLLLNEVMLLSMELSQKMLKKLVPSSLSKMLQVNEEISTSHQMSKISMHHSSLRVLYILVNHRQTSIMILLPSSHSFRRISFISSEVSSHETLSVVLQNPQQSVHLVKQTVHIYHHLHMTGTTSVPMMERCRRNLQKMDMIIIL